MTRVRSVGMLDRLPLDSPGGPRSSGAMPGATVFHHPVWAAVIAGAYGFGAFALALRRGEAGEGTSRGSR